MKLLKKFHKKIIIGIFIVLTTAGSFTPTHGSNTQSPIDAETLYLTSTDVLTNGFQISREIDTSWNVDQVGSIPSLEHAFKLFIKDNYAYITNFTFGDSSFGSIGPDVLFVVDISAPKNPQIVGTLDHDLYNEKFGILTDVFVDGNDAYLADWLPFADGTRYSRIYRIDVSDPYHPRCIQQEGDMYSSLGNAFSVYVQGSNLFATWFDGGMAVYDISYPPWMFFYGYLDIDGAQELYIRGNYAYINSCVWGGVNTLKIVNISNPEIPVVEAAKRVGSIPYSITVLPRRYPSGETPDNERTLFAYVTEVHGFNIFNVTNPTTIEPVSFYQVPSTCGFADVSGDYAALAVGYGIEILNISDPLHPRMVGHYPMNWSGIPAGYFGGPVISMKNDLIYISGWNDGFQILQFTGQKEGWPDKPGVPTGPNEGYRKIDYSFSTVTTDPQGDQVYYQWSWGNGEMSEWLGPFDSGDEISTANTWSDLGTYEVRVRSKDVHENIGDWSEPLPIDIINQAPAKPETPSGPTNGNPGVDYTFLTKAIDPDNDQVQYGWDWDGDHMVDIWTSYYDSNVLVEGIHNWSAGGIYEISVRARDSYMDQSDWSEPLTIAIKNAELSVEIKSGLGVTAFIQNIGDAEATDVQYIIQFNGGLVLLPKNGVKEGTVDNIPAGEQASVRVFVFGFGRTEIKIEITSAETPPVFANYAALIIGPFVIR